MQVVLAIDPVDEDHPRLGEVIGRAHDPVPQVARLERAMDLAVKDQIPGPVGLDRLDEAIGDQNRKVEIAQPRRVGLGRDEFLDVRMVAAHRRHHRPPAGTRAHDRAAHRVPHIHEGYRPAGLGRDAAHLRPTRTDGGEILPDAAALLHGQRRLAHPVEDAVETVGKGAHDETVEKRHVAIRACTGEDSPGRQKAEILQRSIEPLLPGAAVGLGRGERARNPPPGVLDGAVDRRAVQRLEAILHVPDGLGDRGSETCHAVLSKAGSEGGSTYHPLQSEPSHILCSPSRSRSDS